MVFHSTVTSPMLLKVQRSPNFVFREFLTDTGTERKTLLFGRGSTAAFTAHPAKPALGSFYVSEENLDQVRETHP